MAEIARFPFSTVRNALGEIAMRPILPVTLSHQGISIEAAGLLDTGADVNVLPFGLGVSLGADWNQARTGLRLSGNLAQYEARGILVQCAVRDLPAVKLAFAWTRAVHVPLLFGQVNFFAEFDVCFFRAQNAFEIGSR